MTLLKDNNYKDINVALLSLEADIKNKITGGFDTSVIDKQLAEINSRIDKINAGNNNSSAEINDIRYEIENINSRLNANSVRIESIEQKLSEIFSADNEVTDFNTTTNSGIYYWLGSSANKPGTDNGVLLVNKYDSRDGTSNLWVNQIAYGTNNKIYFRQNINSTGWTEWKAVAFDGEGTADHANAPTGFEIYPNQPWGNQDGVFITDWRTVQGGGTNNGDIAFRFNDGQVNVLIDGVFYQNEGRYRLVDENSLKAIMKPNYTTGKFPAGVYSAGATVYINATITTTRGNPVFISYSGDFNSVDHGSNTPWIWFELYVDGQLVQTTAVDHSVALNSDNTAFAGSALAVLSAGSHTIKLAASLIGGAGGRIQFQEQDNLVNLVAFEL